MAGTLLAACISIPFTVLYSIQLNNFYPDTNTCIASRGSGLNYEQIDVTPQFLMLLKFGFGLYLTQTCILIFTIPSGFHWAASLVNSFFQCLVCIPQLVQVIYLGIYRYRWAGQACSQSGAPFENQG